MNSIIDARICSFLRNRLHVKPFDTGAVLFRIRTLARVAGYDVDSEFGRAGLASGPDGRIAAAIVDSALGGGGGSATSDYTMMQAIARWVRTTRPMGM